VRREIRGFIRRIVRFWTNIKGGLGDGFGRLEPYLMLFEEVIRDGLCMLFESGRSLSGLQVLRIGGCDTHSEERVWADRDIRIASLCPCFPIFFPYSDTISVSSPEIIIISVDSTISLLFLKDVLAKSRCGSTKL
jgi:hypothetical protein